MEYNKSDLASYLFSQVKTLNEIRNLTTPYIEKEKKKDGKEMTFCSVCNKDISAGYYKFHLLSKKHMELDQAFVTIKKKSSESESEEDEKNIKNKRSFMKKQRRKKRN